MTAVPSPSGFAQELLPALRLGETIHPRSDRRRVSLRWLMATMALGLASAALLGGVLQATLRRGSKLRQPEFAIVQPSARVIATDGRTDRIVPRSEAAPARPSPISSRTLQSTGFGDRPLTVLVARLDHMSALTRVPDELSAPLPIDAPPPGTHDRSSPLAGAMRPLLLFGSTIMANGGHPMSYTTTAIPVWAEPGPFGTAVNVTIRSGSPPPAPDRTTTVVAQRGDTLDRLLPRFGFSIADIHEIAAAFEADALAGGEKIVLRQMSDQGPEAAGRPIDVRLDRPDGSARIAALSDAGHYLRVAPDDGDRNAATREGLALGEPGSSPVDDATLRDGIDAMAGHEGIGRALVANVLRLMGTDVDLGESVADADRIEILYGGALPDAPADQELDYAALTAGGRTTRLYRFASADDNSVDYYDDQGHSLTKFLLRKPVANGRLGDGFGWRTHPILGDRRFHEGVDYAAPYGSPIVAAGAGTVEKIDYEAGYGKYIRIRHDLGYETTYAHVSGFPRGIVVGRRVQQGETIALIGSTGLSTGPHLYYEVKVNDRNVDPTRIKIAAGRILDGATLANFQRRRERIDLLLRASRDNRS